MENAKRYLDEWSSCEDVLGDYPSSQLTDSEIVFAHYSYMDYSGYATVIFQRDGKLYENTDGHCSCNGLENWEPQEITWDQLAMRKHMWPELEEIVRSHVPRA